MLPTLITYKNAIIFPLQVYIKFNETLISLKM